MFTPTRDDRLVASEMVDYYVRRAKFDPAEPFPCVEQWRMLKSDLDAIPKGLWVWCDLIGVPSMVLTYDHPLTDLAPFVGLRGTPVSEAAGLTGPVCSVRVNHAYPIFDSGVGHAGTAVATHEWGHMVGRLFTPSRGKDATEPGLFWQPDWVRVWQAAKWPWSKLLADNREEAGAESFAVYCLRRQGDPNGHAPTNMDPIVFDFWDRTLKSAGWL